MQQCNPLIQNTQKRCIKLYLKRVLYTRKVLTYVPYESAVVININVFMSTIDIITILILCMHDVYVCLYLQIENQLNRRTGKCKYNALRRL